jgi:succinoglycan biosynthesis protein ExoM
MVGKIHICVCICTYKRPELLKRLLTKLEEQETEDLFDYSIVIVDNDSSESAREPVDSYIRKSKRSISYYVETEKNIALTRNKAWKNAKGEFVAFIDDDEYPVTNWLKSLLETYNANSVGGVLGPVVPYFEQEPPEWIIKGGIFERPRHETGFGIGLSEARTGNVLLSRKVLVVAEGFSADFGTGGEDVDFFRRVMDKGTKFIWCDEAVAYELVPPARCTRSYLLRRALLRGKNSFKQQGGNTNNLIKSIVAVPLYGLALPFLYIAGHHHFMEYLIKTCDHAGRLLALIGLNPISERDL